MCKHKKILIILTILFLVASVIFFTRGNEIIYVSMIMYNQSVKPDETKMAKIFERDKALLEDVSIALLEADGDFRISDIFGTSELSEDADRLDETTLKKAKTLINKKGYSIISKKENEVHFQYWENMDEGRGFVYCIHTDSPKTLDFLVHSKALGGNWHYYEDSFNRWKVQNAG